MTVLNSEETPNFNLTIINICWEKIDYWDFKTIAEKKTPLDWGLYQIYGHHPAYGDDALLYIGKTGINFATRLPDRSEFNESCARPTSIRLGRFVKSSKKENDPLNIPLDKIEHIISMAEKILIKSHAPSMNKQEISGLCNYLNKEDNEEYYLIINWEDYGRLLPEISTLRLSYRFWDFETPISNQ